MKLKTPRHDTMERDDLIPLINVIFLLLIFFMIAGTLTHRPEIPVDYVETSTSPAATPPPDTLIVTAAGEAHYEGSLVEPGALGAVIAGDATLDRAAPFPVIVDRAVTMADLAPVTAALREAGLATLKIITRNDRS